MKSQVEKSKIATERLDYLVDQAQKMALNKVLSRVENGIRLRMDKNDPVPSPEEWELMVQDELKENWRYKEEVGIQLIFILTTELLRVEDLKNEIQMLEDKVKDLEWIIQKRAK